jgi:uncharacterized protein (TIGR03437 family)
VARASAILLVFFFASHLSGQSAPSIRSIVNAASFAPGPLAPGSLATVFGTFPVASAVTSQGPSVPTTLGGLSIQFSNSLEAPLFYVSPTQVNFQVPWELAGAAQVTLTVTVNGQSSAPQAVNLAPVSPAIFSINASGSGQGAILNTSQLLVNSTNPAAPASTAIEIFATGLGPVNNQPPTGTATPLDGQATTTMSPNVTIGGISTQVLFSGLAPGLTGVYQVNAAVPLGILPGSAVPVVISIGGSTSNSVTIVVAPQSPGWPTFAHDAQHAAFSPTTAQPLNAIHWQTPVDLSPQFTNGELFIHYGSPLVTPQNTVILPVKTGASGGFRVEAHSGDTGAILWATATDYILPPHDWVPEFSPALSPSATLYFPGAGGTVYYRENADSSSGNQGQLAFYGIENYQTNPQTYSSNVMISTPIVSDSMGNIYFGFVVTGSTPQNLTSGIARIGANGQGAWISAASAAGDPAITEVAENCAPAVNSSLGLLYVAVSNGDSGYLLALNSATLQPVDRVALTDPVSGQPAYLSDDGTASPFIGPDGDVYYGVLESPTGENHYRGWLLHFDSALSKSKLPGAFGWDDTPSLVPGFMVPSYSGTSSYLLMTKYNDYADAGGTGLNRIAILDPNTSEKYPVTDTSVMNEVLTILGPTPSTTEPGVKEWCINTAAVDPSTNSILANSEDGKLYRWNLTNNTFSQSIVLTPGLGEAYTPTLIGADGTVYAINNATLFAVGQ